jgi:heme/copper-type cytochrome/quinol oxidase subunit 2
MLLVTAQTETQTENEVWAGWGSVFFVLGIMTIVAIVATVLIWQIFRTRQATIESRARIAQEEVYRRLAEEGTSAQNRTAAELTQLTEGMADLRVRVATIERMLREVD